MPVTEIFFNLLSFIIYCNASLFTLKFTMKSPKTFFCFCIKRDCIQEAMVDC
jgi:hypothetical protein